MAISQQIIDQIKQRASIVDLVSERVTLKSAGRRMTGLCPFHQEKTPSFYVREEEGDYICFGCGKKGSIFDFVMEIRAFTFPEAVKYLGARYGIEVPEDSPRDKEEKDKKQKLHKYLREIIIAVVEVYEEELARNKAAQDYVKARGISEKSLATFQVGFAPAAWDFLVDALSKKLKEKGKSAFVEHPRFLHDLERLGLSKNNSEGRTYDAFRDRLIFPIARSDGAPIALGGRIITKREGAPKYINSPETEIYQKRQTLYGVHTALNALRATRQAYLVEGYMDVISMHQRGLENTLAACGTAITQDHGQLLRRFCDRLTLVFDGDEAGKKAAARSFEVFLNTGIEIYAVLLPDGEDPDSLCLKYEKDALEKLYRERSLPIVEVYIERLLTELQAEEDAPSAVISGKAAKRFVATVRGIENPVEREQVLKQGAEKLGVSLSALSDLMQQLKEVQVTSMTSVERRTRPSPEEGASELRATPKQITRPNLLEKYYSELLVAIILEPHLALKLTKQIDLQEEDVLPENITNFLRAVSEVGFKVSNTASADLESDLGEMQELLSAHSLAGESLVKEALRARSVGGARPEHVTDDLLKVILAQKKKEELRQIRKRESEAGDEQSLERSVQEKLMARRGEV